MARMRIATQAERARYAESKPVYSLHGFIKVGGVKCAVERCGIVKGDPQYEIMAPSGFHFDEERLHSLLCFSVDDVSQRVSYQKLEPCTKECN